MGWWAGLLIFLTITLPGPVLGSVDGMRWLGLGILAAMGWFVARGLDRALWGFGLWALTLALAIPGTSVPWAGAEAVIRVLCLAGVVLLARRIAPRAWLGWLCAALVVQGAIAVAQHMGVDPLASIFGMPTSIQETGDLRYAVHGTQGHRNLLAGLLVAGAPLAWLHLGWGWGAALATVAVATGSQGAILAVLGALGAMGVARFRGLQRTAVVCAGILGLGIGVAWLAHSGAQGRELIWPQCVKMVTQAPLRGVGPGGFSNGFAAAERHRLKALGRWDAGGLSAKHAHNELLHAAVTAGVPGAVGLAAAWCFPLIGLFRREEWDPSALAGLAATGAVLAHSMVSFPLSVVSPALVAALGLGIALGPPHERDAGPIARWLAPGLGAMLLIGSGVRWLADVKAADAKKHLRAERWSEAYSAGLNAMALFPDDPTAAYRAAVGAWRGGRVQEAEALFRESLRANDHHVGRRDLGLLLAERGKAEESIELLTDYLLIHPGSSPRPWMVLGAQHLTLGDAKAAQEAFIRCQCPDGFLATGRLLYAAKRIPDALYRWRQVEDDRGWARILEHHVRHGEWAEARTALDQIDDGPLREKWAGEIPSD